MRTGSTLGRTMLIIDTADAAYGVLGEVAAFYEEDQQTYRRRSEQTSGARRALCASL